MAAADACVSPRVSLGRARDLKNAAAEMSSDDEDKEKFIVLAKTLIRSAAAAVEGSL